MSDASHVQEHLSAYLDGELSGADRERLEAHLGGCALCSSELEALREVHARLCEIPPHDPGASYWKRFPERVASRLPGPVSAGPERFYERLAAWFLPSGRLAWPRAATALATITLVTYVGVRGFRDAELPPPAAVRPEPPDVAAAPDASEPPVREKMESGRALAQRRSATPQAPAPSPLGPPPSPPAPPSPPLQKPVPAPGALVLEAPDARLADEASFGIDAPSEATDESKGRPDVIRIAEPLGKPRVTVVLDAQGPDAAAKAKRQGVTLPGQAVLRPTGPAAHGLDQVARMGVATDLGRPGVPELEIVGFVSAAIAGDSAAARSVYARLAAQAAAGRGPHAAAIDADRVTNVDLEHMREWLRLSAPHGLAQPERRRLDVSGSRVPDSSTGEAALLALDRLVWPRHAEAALQSVVEALAVQLARRAGSSVLVRQRARAYLEWLADHADGHETRGDWRQRLERLPD
ncbi:MAG: anti-sigma factor family protein [Candidatus Krumholzibacteriia bacterium]